MPTEKGDARRLILARMIWFIFFSHLLLVYSFCQSQILKNMYIVHVVNISAFSLPSIILWKRVLGFLIHYSKLDFEICLKKKEE